ncbi:hypothetical protein ABIE69_002262 [Rhodobacteraceae bacterium MBR-64]|jgi:hypothetical protein
MATFSEQELHIAIGEKRGLVDGTPRRDVVGFSADDKNWHRDILERDHPPLDGKAARRDAVFQKYPAQIFRMHPCRHPRRIIDPDGHIHGQIRLSEEIAPHRARPDQIFGPDRGKGPRRLWPVEIALRPHQVLQKGDLTLVEEKQQLARFGEIHLRGHQRDRGEALVTVARHRRRRDGQKRAAKTIAAGMHLLPRNDRVDHLQRLHDPLLAILLQRQFSVFRAGIAP